MTALRLADRFAYADLATLVARVRAVDPDAAVRLHAVGPVLRVYAGVLPGRGLFAEGAAVGARGMVLADPADLDVTVSAVSLADRFARDAEGPLLPVPPATVRAAWVGSLPGTGGWTRVGQVAAEALRTAAQDGIAEVAREVSGPAGAPAVEALRERVWGRPTPTDPAVPAGAAFAAYTLGLFDAGPVVVLGKGRWVRLTTGRGHVLAR